MSKISILTEVHKFFGVQNTVCRNVLHLQMRRIYPDYLKKYSKE